MSAVKITAMLAVFAMGATLAAEAQTPQATELPGAVFSITKTWTIGGEGNWDYLTLDPEALQLYIAHGSVVQVVDVAQGTLTGEVKGLHDAHSVALDANSQFGFVSDGPANVVRAFDRRTFEIAATIPTEKNPRAIVYEPMSRLMFVICPDTESAGISPQPLGEHGEAAAAHPYTGPRSTITVIDPDTQKRIADLIVPGKLGFAQADGQGRVYVAVTDHNAIAYFNAQTLQTRLRQADNSNSAPSTPNADTSAASAAGATNAGLLAKVDWISPGADGDATPRPFHMFPLQNCVNPKGLALDSANERVFVACDNMKMQVMNSRNGQIIATLPIGAGTDAIGYDAKHGLIYTSNGGGVGSLTVIRQHLTDSYAVIQEMPTQARARTLAIDPESGKVYLVTNLMGFDLRHKGGVGDLKSQEVQGSFQVLVVGN